MPTANRSSLVFSLLFLGLLLAQIFPFGQSLASHFESFPARDALVSSVTEFRLALGDRVFHDTLIGPNHWLVYATDRSMDKFQNLRPMTKEQLDEYAQSLLAFQSLVESNGGKLLLVTAPYKNTIYPENVPAEIRRIGTESHLDQIRTRLEDTSVQVLDLRPVLFAARQDAQIYYATDSHWNDLGGFAAYQDILEFLSLSFPALTPPRSLSDYKVTHQPPKQLDLSYIIGSTSLDEERVQLQPKFKQTARLETLTLPSGRHITFARTDNSSLPTALFFHDSFLYTVMPFLSEHFSRTIYEDMLAGNDMLPAAWVEQFQPDVVVIVLNEHFLDILPQLLAEGRAGFE